MIRFRSNPELEPVGRQPSGRGDEIGIAAVELDRMQQDLRAALRQKARLAALGAAIAKINHDLRNFLATAVLISDRLATVDEPEVRKLVPQLTSAIDRAVALCTRTLDFVRADTPALQWSRFKLADLLREVETSAWALSGPPASRSFRVSGGGLVVHADRQQLLRVLGNLALNAARSGASRLQIDARFIASTLQIDVADNGPGLPSSVRDHLFQPFAGPANTGGTGLGLVIAHEIVVAHGGTLSLIASSAAGTTFRIELPQSHDEAVG
jgi:signal transduction histidine kinase